MQQPIFAAIGVLVLLALIFLDVQIGVALLAVGFVGLVLIRGIDPALQATSLIFFTVSSNYGYSVLPLFIIMGTFAADSGVVPRAFDFASKWLSNTRGGLYFITTLSCALFATVTGSALATIYAIGKAIVPKMRELKYDTKMSLGCVAISGTLGVMIPPSIPFVVYGIATEESIGKLLLAGIIPGVLEAVVYMLGMYIMVRINPSLGPPAEKYTMKEKLKTIPHLWGLVLLFGIVVGGIYSGIFTPTEAGAWGTLAAFLLLALNIKGGLFKKARSAGWDAVSTTAMIFLLIMSSEVFTFFLTASGGVDALVHFIRNFGLTPLVVISFVIVISFLFGMFLSATAALLLVAPIAHAMLIPLGYSGIWLGVILVALFELATLTPPVALCVFAVKSLAPDVPLEDVYKGTFPFMVLNLLIIIILCLFPQIALWLPSIAFTS